MKEKFRTFLEKVCLNYKLGGLRSYSFIDKGIINTKYLIHTSEGKFVIRLSIRSAKQLSFEVALLNHVKFLQVPKLKSDRQGKFINFYRKIPYIVYQYIEGINPKKITSSLIKQLAKFQAHFHKLGFSFKKNINREPYTYYLPPAKIKKLEKKILKGTPEMYLKQYFTVRDVILGIKFSHNLPKGPIHVDIKPENTLVKNNKLTGILDFDNSYIGSYLVDIGKTLTWYGVKEGRINWSFIKVFLRQYNKIRPLKKIEKYDIDQTIKYAVASHIFIDYYKLSQGIIPLPYLKTLLKEFYPVLEKKIMGRKYL